MALATPPLLQQRVSAIASRKRFAVVTTFTTDVALRVKFNPDWEEGLSPGVKALAATVVVDATDIVLRVDGTIDRSITLAPKTVQVLIDEINATQSDGTNRWRAGLGDLRPAEIPVPRTLSEENAMLGYLNGVPIFAAATVMHAAAGTDRSNRGEGYFLPDGFNTNYDYPLQGQTGGIADPLPSQVGRAGGIDASQGEDFLPQRRSAFRNSPAALARERSSAATRFVTRVDSILADGLVASTDTIASYTIWDIDGTAKWATDVAIATQFIAVPNVECNGPAFLTVVGDALSAFTAGTVTMQGDIRVA